MKYPRVLMLVLAMAALGGCATVPAGPSVMVLPASGKSFEAFKSDDCDCRQWAEQQVNTTPGRVYSEGVAGGAAVGTLVGAGLGAAVGAASGNAGAGAAIGGASGFLMGTTMAAGPANQSAWEVQRRYDIAYQQCMYLKGNHIPGLVRASRRAPPIPPPPPPGYPPTRAATGGGLPPPPPPNPH